MPDLLAGVTLISLRRGTHRHGSLLFLALAFLSGRLMADAAPLLGPPPGVVIDRSPDPAKFRLFSPSLVVLPDGKYAASFEGYGFTQVKISPDRGLTWHHQGKVPDLKWATIFIHRDALYLIGVSRKAGSMVIRRSLDQGVTWTEPLDAKTGLLGSSRRYHCAPVPVVVHQGRIWRAFEEFAVPPDNKPRHFGAFVISAPVEADLLDAASWTHSNKLTFHREWLQTRNEEWLEGNVVVTPAGDVVNILRVESHPVTGHPAPFAEVRSGIPRFEVAARMRVSAAGKQVEFDPEKDFIPFIGSESKFTIRYDPVSKRYWTLANKITNLTSGTDWTRSPHHQRNVIALTSSADLSSWTETFRLLSYEAGSAVVKAGSRVGFQYLDWQFDGNDLIAVCRMSWDGADYHDTNCITFHRMVNFRTLTIADSPPDLSAGMKNPTGPLRK